MGSELGQLRRLSYRKQGLADAIGLSARAGPGALEEPCQKLAAADAQAPGHPRHLRELELCQEDWGVVIFARRTLQDSPFNFGL